MRVSGIAKFSVAAAAVGVGCAAYFWSRALRREAQRLTAILDWRPGASVADVGAGSGTLAIVAAGRVGPTGRVFASEIDPKKRDRIRKRTAKHRLGNVSVVEAEDGRSGLPPGSCDAILLRGSYHHFTDAAGMTADLYQALRPGGVLAVIDFQPRRWLTLIAPVKGVPANRGGHGIPMGVLTQEITGAGFELKERIPRWFLDVYCVVFRKPIAAT